MRRKRWTTEQQTTPSCFIAYWDVLQLVDELSILTGRLKSHAVKNEEKV